MVFSEAKKTIIVIAAATILSAFSSISILFYSEPGSSGLSIILLLYLSLFLSSLGILTFLGLAVRKIWFTGLFAQMLAVSFRQALLLSFYFTACLGLSSKGLLYWWVALALFLPIASLEAILNLKI